MREKIVIELLGQSPIFIGSFSKTMYNVLHTHLVDGEDKVGEPGERRRNLLRWYVLCRVRSAACRIGVDAYRQLTLFPWHFRPIKGGSDAPTRADEEEFEN